MVYTPPINTTNLGVPTSSVSKHWATLMSPSPSPGGGSQATTSVSNTSSPSSAGPSEYILLPTEMPTHIIGSSISLPPLHTAVPMARLESYRRGSDSISPIREMKLRQPPVSAGSRPIFPSISASGPNPHSDRRQHSLPSLIIQTPNQASPFAFTAPDYPNGKSLKSPRKRGKSYQPYQPSHRWLTCSRLLTIVSIDASFR